MLQSSVVHVQKMFVIIIHPDCYSRGTPYFFFVIYLSQLYTLLSFLLQWLCHYSLSELSWRSGCPDLGSSDLSPFSRQYHFPTLLCIVWSFSLLRLLESMSTFLVLPLIVLPTRKTLIGLVYKPTHLLSLSLASSMLYLHSNLVSSLGLPVWLKLHWLLVTMSPSKKTNRNSMCPRTTLECALLEIRLCRLCVTILFPYRSILVILHSHHLLTWRGRGSTLFLNTTYLLVHSFSTFSLVNLSSDTLIS